VLVLVLVSNEARGASAPDVIPELGLALVLVSNAERGTSGALVLVLVLASVLVAIFRTPGRTRRCRRR
jgi:hypothetical protein